jgi:hypothetical protein
MRPIAGWNKVMKGRRRSRDCDVRSDAARRFRGEGVPPLRRAGILLALPSRILSEEQPPAFSIPRKMNSEDTAPATERDRPNAAIKHFAGDVSTQ